MARVQELMAGLDSPRQLPIEMQQRIESSLVFATVAVTEENLAQIIDRPKALPQSLRKRIEALFVRRPGSRYDPTRTWQVLGAAAVAAIVLIGTLIALPNRPGKSPLAQNPTVITTIDTETPPPSTVDPPKNNQPPQVKDGKTTKPATVVKGTVRRATGTVTVPRSFDNGNAVADGSAPGTSTRSTASRPGAGGSTNLLDTVTSLVDRLLSILNQPPSSGVSKGSSGQVPVDDASLVGSLVAVIAPKPAAPPAAPAAKKAAPARTKSTGRSRTTNVPAPRAKKTAPVVPLSIPLLSSLTGTVAKTSEIAAPVVGSIL